MFSEKSGPRAFNDISVGPEIAPGLEPDTPIPTGGSDKTAPRSVSVDAGAARPHRHSSASALSAGNLLYLASVGLVAIAIIGVFFGTGLSLLVPSAGGTISRGPGAEVRSPAYSLLPPSRGVESPPEGELSSSGAASPLPPRPVTEESSPQGEDAHRRGPQH